MRAARAALSPLISTAKINCKAENTAPGSENCLHLPMYTCRSYHCLSMLTRADCPSGLTAMRSWHTGEVRFMRLSQENIRHTVLNHEYN